MRAIGKGSLSSILAVGLHITRVILFFVVFGLSIAMLVMPIAAAFGGQGMDSGSYFGVGYHLVAVLAIVAVFVLSEVFREGARMKEEQDLTV